MSTATIEPSKLGFLSYEEKRDALGQIALDELRTMQMQSRGILHDYVDLNGSSRTPLRAFLERNHFRGDYSHFH